MLGLTGDPVRQTWHGHSAIQQSSSQHSSRAACRVASYHKRHRAAGTAHQAATAFTGGHGAGPCASAAAAAATAMQDLLVQVSQEEQPAHRYPQHTLDVGHMQLHQLQHHDQVLLQQQLEHLHQQHRHRQRHKQQQQQQQQQQQDEPQQLLETQQQHTVHQSRGVLELIPPAHTGSVAENLQHAVSETFTPQDSLQQQDSLQHEWHDSSRALAADRRVAEQTAAAVSHLWDAAVVETAKPSNSSTHSGTSRSSCAAAPASSSSSSLTQLYAAAQPAVGVVPAALHTRVHEDIGVPSATHRVHELAAQQGTSVQAQQPPQQESLPQAQQQQQHCVLERTVDGLPLVRLHRGCKPAQVAAVLCSHLLQEQQVVLSAAGADLALLALNCLERAVCLQQQQQPGSLLLAVPQFRCSKRPVGGGKCQVYDLVCTVQYSGVEQQQQQAHERDGAQTSGHSQPPEQLDGRQLRQRPQQQGRHVGQHQQGFWQGQNAQGGAAALAAVGLQSGARCCSSSRPSASSGVQYAAVMQEHTVGSAAACCADSLDQQHQQGSWQLQAQQQQQWQTVGYQQGSSHASQLVLQHAGNGNGRHKQSRQQQQPQPGISWQHAALCHSPSNGADTVHGTKPVVAHGQQSSPAGQQHCQEPQQQQQQQQPVAASVPVLKVAGCSMNFADALEDTLDSAAAGAVMLPVAHAKQAVRVLEAVSLLSTRMQQWQARQAWRAQLTQQGPSDNSLSSSSGSSSVGVPVAGMQLVVQPRRGKVRGQSGTSRGLHVFVYAAPLV